VTNSPATPTTKRYPVLLQALETGLVDLAKERTMIRGVGHVDDDVAGKALDLILSEAPNLTTGQIAARLRRLVIEADSAQANKAYDEDVAQARVWSTLEPDGTGTMIATGMEAHDLAAANRNINGMARRRKNAGDSRSIDKIRSEVFAQLLTGELAPDGKKARVNITGNLETMERLNNEVGYLEGFGRSMLTSCGRSSTSNTTLPGPSRSRTQQPARSMWAPRHVAPLHPSSANSRRDTRPVSLPDVVSLRLNATSTTSETGRSVG
jgi:hypothetical protein